MIFVEIIFGIALVVSILVAVVCIGCVLAEVMRKIGD